MRNPNLKFVKLRSAGEFGNMDDDLKQAEDATPKQSIGLRQAYDRLLDIVSERPQILPKFEEEWCEALTKSREAELQIGHDPETFDKELQEEWHLRKQVNLMLRLAIEARELIVCTRDPETGDILRLAEEAWIPSDWADYIPPGIWSNYIIPNSYEEPGPSGSFIRGALRPVFFILDEFEKWLNNVSAGAEASKAHSTARVRTH